MTKEEFKKGIADIKSKMSHLRTQDIEMRSSYLENNREFVNGEQVKGVHHSGKCEKGIVVSAYVDDNGEIKYSLRKVKLDGTESKHALYVYKVEKMTN